MKPNKKVKLIFFLLVVYVLFQFFWWSYLIYELNTEVVLLKQQAASAANKVTPNYTSVLHKKLDMILGEGSVFLILLSFGIYQIYRALKKQENLTRQQNNFMLSITHELKTPLASTRLQLETILKRDLPIDKRSQILQNALSDIDRLNQLIENILLASRVESHHFTVHLEEVNLVNVLENLINKSNLFAGQKHRININIKECIFLTTDEFALSTILINLIDNALKYSSDKVDVIVYKQKEKIIIDVCDNGHGVLEEEKELIFQNFYRSGSEETRKTKGTGLGLYIVKHLAKAIKADIQVLPNKPGSVFKIIV